jgi:GNAT superfamily N-acetyltransferase
MLTRAYRAHRPDFPGDPDVIPAYSRHDPGGGPMNWVVLYDGARPVSALRLFYRTLGVARGVVRMGGIGNVGTDPDYAGRGLATRVMEEAHARLRAEAIDLAVLVTDIPAFYHRLGYRTVEQGELRGERDPHRSPEALGRSAGARPDRDHETLDSARIVPLTQPVRDDVRAWHEAAAARVSGRVVRSVSLWNEWILTFKVQGAGLVSLASPDAYLIARPEDEGRAWRFLEGGGTVEGLEDLARRVGGGAPIWKTPEDPLFAAVLANEEMRVARHVRTGIMALSFDVDGPEPNELGGFLELDTF